MRIGFFGGTFDPPHRGHVALARLARVRLQLDGVLIAPVGSQPLKTGIASAAFDDRVAMTRLAFAAEPDTEISLVDAPRPNGQANYTFETIRQLEREGGDGDRFFCIMGADSFLSVSKWHRAADLLVSCDFIVGARPGFDLGRLTAALPDGIALASESTGKHTPAPTPDGPMAVDLRGPSGSQSRLYLLADLDIDISATAIREALTGGKKKSTSAAQLLPPAVLHYIESHSLYCNC